jgi:hypothetical protein
MPSRNPAILSLNFDPPIASDESGSPDSMALSTAASTMAARAGTGLMDWTVANLVSPGEVFVLGPELDQLGDRRKSAYSSAKSMSSGRGAARFRATGGSTAARRTRRRI